MNTSEILIFATRFNVAPVHAHVLPALFDRAAEMVGMTTRGLIAEATFNNNALGQHLAEKAKEVAEKTA